MAKKEDIMTEFLVKNKAAMYRKEQIVTRVEEALSSLQESTM